MAPLNNIDRDNTDRHDAWVEANERFVCIEVSR
jgi:hypothetical protein